jgi:TonB-dependent SusC/RagA subfamily outer membrane receptor
MPLSIILDEERNVLDDVVVVGYASMKKRDLVGAVDMVDSKVIGDRSNGNLARSLQGEIPGLNIQFNDSKPSRSASFNVRGETSIGSGGSALVLVDGVEGDLNSINPQDVASVSVLKDASSTAVYGARGAFGVILVTTKNPDKGRPVINYSGSVSVNRRTVVPDIITDGLTFVNWWKDAYNGYYNGTKALPDHIDSTVPYTDAIYEELLRRRNNPNLADVTALEDTAHSDGHTTDLQTGMTSSTRM